MDITTLKALKELKKRYMSLKDKYKDLQKGYEKLDGRIDVLKNKVDAVESELKGIKETLISVSDKEITPKGINSFETTEDNAIMMEYNNDNLLDDYKSTVD